MHNQEDLMSVTCTYGNCSYQCMFCRKREAKGEGRDKQCCANHNAPGIVPFVTLQPQIKMFLKMFM